MGLILVAMLLVASSFIGGLRLASEMLRPAVVGFLDKMLHQEDAPVRFAQVCLGPEWSARTLAELDPFDTEELPILAARRRGEEAFAFNPRGDLRLEEGMELVTMGTTERVLRLLRRAGDASAPRSLSDAAEGAGAEGADAASR
ncbi:MAG: hypothetical protein D6731_10155 [Planctomycetota bacterium]|nr:MAG: hypothetical protein D6731_10155 [Planctomycetota bacterium]